jgi:hypothetical protein
MSIGRVMAGSLHSVFLRSGSGSPQKTRQTQ